MQFTIEEALADFLLIQQGIPSFIIWREKQRELATPAYIAAVEIYKEFMKGMDTDEIMKGQAFGL